MYFVLCEKVFLIMQRTDRTGELSEAEIDEGRMAARARFLSMLEQHTALKTTAGQIWGKEKERKKKQRKRSCSSRKKVRLKITSS